MAIPEERGHIYGYTRWLCQFCVFPRCQLQSFFNHRGAEVSQTLPWHYKCKQGRIGLKSQHRISVGDSWPLLTHQQHLAAAAVPGQCLGFVLHIWATRELPLSSLCLNISRECPWRTLVFYPERLCLSTVRLFSWGNCLFDTHQHTFSCSFAFAFMRGTSCRSQSSF